MVVYGRIVGSSNIIINSGGAKNLYNLKKTQLLHVEHGRTLVNLSMVSFTLSISKINYCTKGEYVKNSFVNIKVTPIVSMKHCWANLDQIFGRSGNLNLKIIQLKLFK